jgi:uncharacterized phage-associated protein
MALLTHLWTTYGTIEPGDILANTERMTTPWHPPTPIEDFFDQIENGIRFAIAANAPLPDILVVETAYKNVAATGLFTDDCKAWRARPIAQRTWTEFKTYFLAQSKDRIRVTTAEAGFHSANAATDNATLIAKLAAAEKKIKSLTKKSPNSTSATTTTHPPGSVSYCWTHGTSTNMRHTSKTCRSRDDGHDETATLTDQKKGSTRVYTADDARPRKVE